MKKLLSTYYSDGAFNTAMLLLRLGSGALIMKHGYGKLIKFSEMKGQFINFMGIGQSLSLSLTIFAEFFCAMFLIIGLFTRLFAIPPAIVMLVALFKAHNGDILGEGANAALFLTCFLTILLCGPGKASIDGMIGK